jgi:hypothetical protein
MVRYKLASHISMAAFVAGLMAASAAHAETVKTGGNVINETWTPDGSPYIVQGDITVPSGAFLTIEAGTVVQFASTDAQGSGQDPTRTELIVNGTLTVNGSAAQPVQFAGASTAPGSWYGLVVGTTASAVTIANLQIANPLIGIRHLATAATVNTTAVSITAPGQTGMEISAGAPTYDGIGVAATSLSGTVGFLVDGAGSGTLTNCASRNAASAGIRFNSSGSGRSLTVVNCTLHANGGVGIENSTFGGGTMTVKNTIVSNHSTGVSQASSSASTTVSFSDVWNNTTSFTSLINQGAGNFSSNPLYVSSANLRLTANSPARFSGQSGGDLGGLPFTGDPTPLLEGVLWTATTFTAAGGPYAVAGDLTVGPGVTVTIEPGATFTFAATDGMLAGDPARGELGVRGTLIAGGATGGPVMLQGSSTAPGAWGGLVVEGPATALTMSHVVIASPNIGIRHLATAATVDTTAVSITAPGQTGMEISAGSPTYDGIGVAATSVSGTVGFLVDGAGSGTLANCLSRNAASAGIRFNASGSGRSLTVVNCTLNANGGVGIENSTFGGGTMTVKNTIVSNHSTGVSQASSSASTTVSFSDVWNNTTNFTSLINQASATSRPTRSTCRIPICPCSAPACASTPAPAPAHRRATSTA